jgi:hypothetical protein
MRARPAKRHSLSLLLRRATRAPSRPEPLFPRGARAPLLTFPLTHTYPTALTRPPRLSRFPYASSNRAHASPFRAQYVPMMVDEAKMYFDKWGDSGEVPAAPPTRHRPRPLRLLFLLPRSCARWERRWLTASLLPPLLSRSPHASPHRANASAAAAAARWTCTRRSPSSSS